MCRARITLIVLGVSILVASCAVRFSLTVINNTEVAICELYVWSETINTGNVMLNRISQPLEPGSQHVVQYLRQGTHTLQAIPCDSDAEVITMTGFEVEADSKIWLGNR